MFREERHNRFIERVRRFEIRRMSGSWEFDDRGARYVRRYLADEIRCEELVVFAGDHQGWHRIASHVFRRDASGAAAAQVFRQIDIE